MLLHCLNIDKCWFLWYNCWWKLNFGYWLDNRVFVYRALVRQTLRRRWISIYIHGPVIFCYFTLQIKFSSAVDKIWCKTNSPSRFKMGPTWTLIWIKPLKIDQLCPNIGHNEVKGYVIGISLQVFSSPVCFGDDTLSSPNQTGDIIEKGPVPGFPITFL